jgi:hypothetical protein
VDDVVGAVTKRPVPRLAAPAQRDYSSADFNRVALLIKQLYRPSD